MHPNKRFSQRRGIEMTIASMTFKLNANFLESIQKKQMRSFIRFEEIFFKILALGRSNYIYLSIHLILDYIIASRNV